jgi:hypothetical protein
MDLIRRYYHERVEQSAAFVSSSIEMSQEVMGWRLIQDAVSLLMVLAVLSKKDEQTGWTVSTGDPTVLIVDLPLSVQQNFLPHPLPPPVTTNCPFDRIVSFLLR